MYRLRTWKRNSALLSLPWTETMGRGKKERERERNVVKEVGVGQTGEETWGRAQREAQTARSRKGWREIGREKEENKRQNTSAPFSLSIPPREQTLPTDRQTDNRQAEIETPRKIAERKRKWKTVGGCPVLSLSLSLVSILLPRPLVRLLFVSITASTAVRSTALSLALLSFSLLRFA